MKQRERSKETKQRNNTSYEIGIWPLTNRNCCGDEFLMKSLQTFESATCKKIHYTKTDYFEKNISDKIVSWEMTRQMTWQIIWQMIWQMEPSLPQQMKRTTLAAILWRHAIWRKWSHENSNCVSNSMSHRFFFWATSRSRKDFAYLLV